MTALDEAAESWAATRDAAWYDRPNVRSDKVVHMGGNPRDAVMSRCGRSVLDDNSTWVPGEVPQHLRCRRTGCRQAWPGSAEATL